MDQYAFVNCPGSLDTYPLQPVFTRDVDCLFVAEPFSFERASELNAANPAADVIVFDEGNEDVTYAICKMGIVE